MNIIHTLSLLLLFFVIGNVGLAQQTNVALNKPVVANSENESYPAKLAVDGKITRNSKWMSGDVVPPHILEIDLQKYCDIHKIVVHTGIPENERTPAEAGQANGFWSAKNFKLQYWDDANWTDIARTEVLENRLTEVPFTFSAPLNTFKIRFVCDDGEPISIMEIEVLGTETNRVGASMDSDLSIKTARNEDQDLTIKVLNNIVCKSMKYVGYNQGYYMPGSNASGWLEYSGVNSLRVWTSLNSYVPATAVQIDKSISTLQEFDERKDELRLNPENNNFIKWNQLLTIYEEPEKSSTNPMVLNYVLSELKRLHIDPVLQINNKDFDETWSNKWQQWQRFYALAYYAAKTGDAQMFAMQNEPNHIHSGPMSLDEYVSAMQIVSDALTCAVEDVNSKYGKSLKAKMVGPVTAGNNPEWWATLAKNLQTDYRGNAMDDNLLGIFSTHSYNSPASGYTDRVNNIRKIISDNHPQGKTLPIVFTEMGRWMNAYLIDKEETMDSPSLFTEWAGIYTNNTKNGAYGMWAFKFANTTSETYTSGVKSGHHFTWQGQRIVEDAYTNLAINKQVITSNQSSLQQSKLVVDGDKSDKSTWHSDSTDTQKWIEIDLGEIKTLGSAVVYTGSAGGVYTAPDRVKSFKLQYFSNNKWNDIPGFTEKNNKYAQLFKTFKEPVSTSKIRFISDDLGMIKVREIKVFASNDGPQGDNTNYNISGIQRTGQVVRLFAKGFKNERPLYETSTSVSDENLDALTSYDEESGNYYMWLVQRGLYTNNITLDLSDLDIAAGTDVTAETVSPIAYGEVSKITTLTAQKKMDFHLLPQSVVLLTIPRGDFTKLSVKASQDATVIGGENKQKNYGKKKALQVQLNAAQPSNNKVSYIHFNIPKNADSNTQRVVLDVSGYVTSGDEPFRAHVYGIPTDGWNQKKITWTTAPLLDDKEALINEVGQKAYVAGEMVFDAQLKNHILDVTHLVNNHAKRGITFVLVRETRQLGDDGDKGREAVIDSSESGNGPELHLWLKD